VELIVYQFVLSAKEKCASSIFFRYSHKAILYSRTNVLNISRMAVYHSSVLSVVFVEDRHQTKKHQKNKTKLKKWASK